MLLLAGSLVFSSLFLADPSWLQEHPARDCVKIESPGKLLSGQGFSKALPRGLRLELHASEPGGWDIVVVDPRTPDVDYMFVASPPYQVAPHHGFGVWWGQTAAESASFTRDLHFVRSARDHKLLFELLSMRSASQEILEALERVKKGSLRLTITGYEPGRFERAAGGEYEGFAWITFAGEACVPR